MDATVLCQLPSFSNGQDASWLAGATCFATWPSRLGSANEESARDWNLQVLKLFHVTRYTHRHGQLTNLASCHCRGSCGSYKCGQLGHHLHI